MNMGKGTGTDRWDDNRRGGAIWGELSGDREAHKGYEACVRGAVDAPVV